MKAPQAKPGERGAGNDHAGRAAAPAPAEVARGVLDPGPRWPLLPSKPSKLELSSPGDADERMADELASQALRPGTPPAFASRGPAKPTDSQGALLELLYGASPSSGRPLDPISRAAFEPRFGVDLGHVRVHTDARANSLAQGLHANAFTQGRDIVFASDRHHPASPAGQRLMAHELAHVALGQGQRGDRIFRAPYTTSGISLDRSDIASVAGQSYWEQRTFQRYFVTSDPRMNSDPEERDAVHAALWAGNPPANVSATRVMTLPISPRNIPAATPGAAPTQAPALLYRFTFEPPGPGSPLPRLELRFVASGAGATAVAAPTAAAAYTPTTPSFMRIFGFPTTGDQPDDYWAAHPDEHRKLFQWMETTAPASFDQTITTTTEVTRGTRTTVTHRSVFHVRGSHSGTTLSNLRITLVSEGTIEAARSVPADYRGHDRADLEFERLRAATRTLPNRLGTVTLPATIPADEVVPVKYAIWQYFDSGHARNTEVDAIVPVGTGSRTVLYTLIFAAHNDVSATRIGEAGSATGQVDTRRMDVARVQGFPGASAAPAALRTWWTARYPQGGTLTPDPTATPGQVAPTPIAAGVLIADMNRLITSGIANRAWFNQNYGIEVLDPTAMTTRLQTTHSVPAPFTTDTLDLDATDLRMLELSLQTMTPQSLAHLRGVKIGRKTQSLTRNGATYNTGGPNQYGLTLHDGTERSVLYFQSLYVNDPDLFRGSTAANARPDVTMKMLHELGHAVGYDAGIEAAFTTWLASHAQTAPTTYAASANVERFPEFFGLYHSDPHFLCGRYPQVYAWFEVLASTGSPPAASARLATPTCPA